MAVVPTTASFQKRLRRLKRLGLLQAYDLVIINLHVRDGLSFREIALRLGQSLGTVNRRWYGRIGPLLRGENPAGDDAA